MTVELACPKCGSKPVGGLMESFYVVLGADGSPVGQWTDWDSETELGSGRLCYDCGHEWDLDP